MMMRRNVGEKGSKRSYESEIKNYLLFKNTLIKRCYNIDYESNFVLISCRSTRKEMNNKRDLRKISTEIQCQLTFETC